MITRYLDPKIDLAFKRVFGEHEHLLRSFLNAMLPLPDTALIDHLEYLTPEQAPDIPGLLKNSIVDVKCTDTQGRIFIVEMQMLWSPSFENRIVFGGAQAYVKQLKHGQDYRSLQTVYVLALVNDRYDRKTDEFYHHYQVVNLQNTQEKLQGLEFVFVELPKFKATTRIDRKMQVLWLRFLSEVGEDGAPPDAQMLANADIASALELVNVAAFSEAELDTYHAGLDKRRIETSMLGDAIEKGWVKGKAEGKAEGIAEGKAEGKAETKAEVAKAMAANGMNTAQISQILQLPATEVERILAS